MADNGGLSGWEIRTTDVLAGLRAMPDACVQLVCTSPPYFGLRAYGTNPQIWGGDPNCTHTLEDGPARRPMTGGTGPASAKQVTNNGSQFGNAWVDEGKSHQRLRNGQDSHGLKQDGRPDNQRGNPKLDANVTLHLSQGATCSRCSAWRGELGSEPTPDLFVSHLVEVFRECKRVMRDDALLAVNLGDSYAGSSKGASTGPINGKAHKQASNIGAVVGTTRAPGVPSKSLILIPERFALAMLADGWIVRSRICWAKRAPMPESVTDRPTSAWEHIFLFSKQAKYFYDATTVREDAEYGRRSAFRSNRYTNNHANQNDDMNYETNTVSGADPSAGRNQRNVWECGPDSEDLSDFWKLSPDPFSAQFCTACSSYFDGPALRQIVQVEVWNGKTWQSLGRICPTCLEYRGWIGHFATFPKEVPRRLVSACTSEAGQCAECGAPWKRTVERGPLTKTNLDCGNTRPHRNGKDHAGEDTMSAHLTRDGFVPGHSRPTTTTGWAPSCRCQTDKPPVPQLVLDPFNGSGTSILVANRLGRRAIGLELNESYAEMSRQRIQEDAPLVHAIAAAPAPSAVQQRGMFET